MNDTGQLGHIVSWRVPQEVSLQTLRDALTAAKLDPALAADMEPRNALARALRDMSDGRVIRRLKREGDRLNFQFTREYLETNTYHYDFETTVTLDLPSGLVSCPIEELAQLARELMTAHRAKRLTSDLTRIMHSIYNAHSADLIPIRDAGGAYFVPQEHADLVDASRVLLAAIGGKLRSFAVRLGSSDTAESVADSLSGYLIELIADFKHTCEKVDADTRSDVVTRRQERIIELRRKLECYRGLLSGYADTIGAEIHQAELDLLMKLAGGTHAPDMSSGAGSTAGVAQLAMPGL